MEDRLWQHLVALNMCLAIVCWLHTEKKSTNTHIEFTPLLLFHICFFWPECIKKDYIVILFSVQWSVLCLSFTPIPSKSTFNVVVGCSKIFLPFLLNHTSPKTEIKVQFTQIIANKLGLQYGRGTYETRSNPLISLGISQLWLTSKPQ